MRVRKMKYKFLIMAICALTMTLAPTMLAQQREVGGDQEERRPSPFPVEPLCPLTEAVGGNATDSFASPFEST
ncbi:MAG TPA: hypothetical protein VLR90_20385, partial [Blastocatellia bacterium]|nr:hypothetical protein [Blastocatellia bacterium]